jgi:hypothetical protein
MNQQLLNELLVLKQRDIDTRSRLLDEGKLYGEYAPEMQQVHRENAKELDKLISKYGWPGISLAGVEGCRAAWLIAQHSICTPELQRKFLTLLTKASERGDAPKAQAAFLTDRIRFNENKPQVYGTVLDWNEAGELSCEVEDRSNLDARRKEVGLAPFQQDLENHRRQVQSEGGKPPADFAQYKQKGREWARNVGWQ